MRYQLVKQLWLKSQVHFSVPDLADLLGTVSEDSYQALRSLVREGVVVRRDVRGDPTFSIAKAQSVHAFVSRLLRGELDGGEVEAGT